jgi:hypothetical protein
VRQPPHLGDGVGAFTVVGRDIRVAGIGVLREGMSCGVVVL